VSKVLVVMEENHSLAEMRSGMPYLAGLSHRYGYAADWHAVRHPSEPNYLAIAGGSTFGVTNDDPPSDNARHVGKAASVFSQALASGHTAATYAEAMPHDCATKDHGNYAVRHNPWAFFAHDRSACRRHDRSTRTFAAAARNDRLPDVGFLIPDLRHDAHDGTLAAADAWLRRTLAPVLASSDFRSGRLVVVVTADEDDHHSGNVVLTSVLTPHLHHVVVRRRLDHYSLTRYVEGVLGVPDLANASRAPDLAAAFGL
jgi:acid phosphatase